MNFKYVAEVFDDIERVSSRLTMIDLIAQLLSQASPDEAAVIAYMSLGSIMAGYRGGQFNYAEKNLIRAIARYCQCDEKSVVDALKKHGDLGLLAGELGWPVSHGDCLLSVNDVEQALSRLMETVGAGSVETKEQHLIELFTLLDRWSAKYVIRIIAGKLRLGFSDMTLLDAFSVMAVGNRSLRAELERAYNVSADIGLIVATLKRDGIEGVRKINIIPGIPIRPAAAERLNNVQEIIEKVGVSVAQPKIDGFRLQVHLSGSVPQSIHFFSRNLQDMSHMFPEVREVVAALNVKNIIFEGEAIAYRESTGEFLPFQETVKRKRKHGVDQAVEEYPLKLFVFDLLFLNDRSLLDLPYSERRTMLLEVFGSNENDHAIVMPIEERIMTNPDELEHYFEDVMNEGLEGLVVKRLDAPYQPGKRNFNWIKLKRQETGSLDDTIDCVILGYYTGYGRRARLGIGALLVGVIDVRRQVFQTIAKIGTGLTDHEWKELKALCDDRSIDRCPVDVECPAELTPDMWVRPELVCIIRADEISRSPIHTAGRGDSETAFALRFPRYMGIRSDKLPCDITTVDEIRSLYGLQIKR